MARREHPRYANTEWPDYEFREYPKMVYPGADDPAKPYDKRGKPLRGIQVHNEDEEREALGLESEGEGEVVEHRPSVAVRATPRRGGKTVETSSKGVERLRTEADEKAEAIEEAEALGIQFDRSWSTARIQDAIDTHRAEVV